MLGGQQVAVLAPTTVLVEQHFVTFSERFRDFPVRVASLSRFRRPAEQKTIVREIEEGKVDVVVGTHRLLSRDVHFKHLGLIVIDEKQRFGVTHKERLKEMRSQVDVLTLTATPSRAARSPAGGSGRLWGRSHPRLCSKRVRHNDMRHRGETQHRLLPLALGKVDGLFYDLNTLPAHDVPSAGVGRNIEPEQSGRYLDLVDGQPDLLGCGPFDSNA